MISNIPRDWNRFWFSPRSTNSLVYPRMAICCVSAVWFASFIGSVSAWFGSEGLLSTDLSRQLLLFDQVSFWQHWSPLWLSDNNLLPLAWLVVGLLLSVLGAAGIGGRGVLLLLLLWVIAWSHRMVWLQGSVEPALSAALAYLIVEPGSKLWGRGGSLTRTKSTWQAGLALRLLQTHWWLLVAAGLMMQLANLIWWRGEGVWWLASADRSHLFSIAMLRGHPSLTNFLSHAVIVAEMLALWLVIIPSARPIGLLIGLIVAGIYGLVADQLLYGALLSAMLLSFVNRAERVTKTVGSQT